MGFKSETVDRIAVRLTQLVIRFRWIVPVIAVAMAMVIGSGAAKLEFSTNYRTFFSKENPELTAFENLQATYTKNDNILFVLESKEGGAFSNSTLSAVEALTTAAWQIPYVIRVDSVTNFQHTRADGDDIIVEDLVVNAAGLTPQELSDRKSVSLAEPLLLNQLVTPSADVTAVNVVLQYPQETLTEVPEAVSAAREIRKNIEAQFEGINVMLTGVSMLNNSFSEVGQKDAGSLMPLMFLAIFVMTWLIVRSLVATFSTLLVIALSTIVAMGVAGFAGVELTPISMSATVVILTLAVADSIHILI